MLLLVQFQVVYQKQKMFQELILNGAVSKTQDLKNMMKLALSGVAILLIKGKDYALAIESRSYHGRSLTEPDSEKTIRGSKDGFNESINDNISLIRRSKKGSGRRQIMKEKVNVTGVPETMVQTHSAL